VKAKVISSSSHFAFHTRLLLIVAIHIKMLHTLSPSIACEAFLQLCECYFLTPEAQVRFYVSLFFYPVPSHSHFNIKMILPQYLSGVSFCPVTNICLFFSLYLSPGAPHFLASVHLTAAA
jgi:hypothetical protein